MKLDTGFEGSLENLGEWARSIESSGRFDGLWVSDTTNDPFLLSTVVALQTESMRLGTNIAVAFARSPYCVAQTAYNLAQVSRGRFTLGLGTQVRAHVQKRFSMTWPAKPIAALVEYVQLLRHLFDCFDQQTRPQFRGTYYQCTLNSPVFSPDRHDFGHPKVGFSAVGPSATKAAGQVADAVFLHPFTHLKYVREVTLPALEAGRVQREKSLGELEVVGNCYCLATDSPTFEEKRRAVLQRLAFYASTPNYLAVLESLGLKELHTELHALSRKGAWHEMARCLPAELIEACVVMAPQDSLLQALEQRFGTVYDRVVIDSSLIVEQS